MHELCMPSLGADMDDAVLLEWRVQPGETVERGAIACVVETQKGAIDVEIWETGTVARLLGEPGVRIAFGTPIAVLADEGEDWQEVAAASARRPGAAVRAGGVEAAALAHAVSSARPGSPAASPVDSRGPPPRSRSSPAARRRAAELGVDLQALSAADGGVVSLADVEAAAAAPSAPRAGAAAARADAATAGGVAGAAGAAGSARGIPVEPRASDATSGEASMRSAIAAAMTRANREIPHYHVGCEIVVEGAWTRLEAFNRERPIAQRVLFVTLVVQAIAGALREVPELNGFWIDGAPRRAPSVHVGVVTSLRGGGIVVPTIHDADRRSLPELMNALREAVTRARRGQLRSSDLADSTITVTNLADSGADVVHGLIYPPQVALVGLGRVAARAVVTDGGVVAARRTMHVTLAADHRASDGLAGARFLAALRERLEHAETVT